MSNSSNIIICELDAGNRGKYVQAYFPDKSLWVGIMLISQEKNTKPEKGVIMMRSCHQADKVCKYLLKNEVPLCESEDVSFSNLEYVSEDISIAEAAQRISIFKDSMVFDDKKEFVDFIKDNSSPETKKKLAKISAENCLVVDSSKLTTLGLKNIAASKPGDLQSAIDYIMADTCDDEVLHALEALGV